MIANHALSQLSYTPTETELQSQKLSESTRRVKVRRAVHASLH
jgi:hypothetical protein